MPNVLLLRTPSETSPDPYESSLRKASYTPYSLPVLETSITNLSDLQALMYTGPQSRGYAGVIITSKRSCEAWSAAAKNQLALLSFDGDNSRAVLKSSLAAWAKVPFYVVGKGTANALEEFRVLCSDSGSDVNLDIRGQDTGTGEQLARFVLEDILGGSGSGTSTLLYLTGDKNRDTVPKILSPEEGQGRKIELEALQVYETHGSTNFESNLKSLVAENYKDNNWWIVFFAPSSADFAYPKLLKHFIFTPNETPLELDDPPHLLTAKVAAIGYVTSAHLEEELKIRVDAIATKPSAEALSTAISTTMR
ncbi:Uroporphyrinogen-III synthase [Leucoagaricus sp. SymC.cos]|nr:Uroporphyrinogen-III synthase [Leucoagaricus sp. SymC.cos]